MTRDELRDRQTHEANPDGYHTRVVRSIDCRWCLGVNVPAVTFGREPSEPVVDAQPIGDVL